jgi:hypothetical protein
MHEYVYWRTKNATPGKMGLYRCFYYCRYTSWWSNKMIKKSWNINNINSYTPESCLESDSYELYFDRTILTDIHIKHNRPDIIILNKQQKQAHLLDIAVPNSHNITQTYNTKINKY